jgi:hypothetical protein
MFRRTPGRGVRRIFRAGSPEAGLRTALLFCLVFAGMVGIAAASEPNALHTRIVHDTTLQGFVCARGDVWFYPDGSLNECRLAQPSSIGGWPVPRGSVIELWPGGAARSLSLGREVVFAGYRVSGGHRGSLTSFDSHGRLRSFALSQDQVVQGVPCRGGSRFGAATGDSGADRVELYPGGGLESCRLARDFSGRRAGERMVFPDLPAVSDNSPALRTAQ